MSRVEIPSLNALDRLIGYVSPSAAVSRLRARTQLAVAGGYKGARRDRRATKRWRPGEGSADADTLPDIPDLRGRSRDLARNMPLATGALSTMVTHTVGVGLTPSASIDRDALGLDEAAANAWERQAEREFRLWSKCADLAETMTFEAVQELTLRSALESGDVLVIRRARTRPGLIYDTRLQLIEADRIANPNHRGDGPRLAGGIQYDADGRPVVAHVSDRHPGDRYAAGMTWRAVPFRYSDGRPICLHIIDRLRVGQSRGVPYLAPVIEALRELEQFTEGELRAAVVSALFTVFIEHEQAAGTSIVDQIPKHTDGSGDLAMSPGAILDLNPGEKASTANPGRPNPQFDPFVMSIMRQIGVALDLPFELLVKHFTASYSASRAALEMAAQSFRRRRLWLVRTLCQPVWEMVIEEAVARGRLIAPGFFDDPIRRAAWLGTEWIGPARLSLDPLKEARADEVDLKNLVKTRQQICTERTGGDFERKAHQSAKERDEIERLGLKAPEPASTGASAAREREEEEEDA